jgi:hypothetical protein
MIKYDSEMIPGHSSAPISFVLLCDTAKDLISLLALLHFIEIWNSFITHFCARKRELEQSVCKYQSERC